MRQNGTDGLLSYWRALQGGTMHAPLRKDFDPVRLKMLVPRLLMIGAGKTQYRFRLSGGFLVTLHGHELKDLSFLSLFHATYHQALRTALIMATRQERPVLFSAKGHTSRHEDFTMDIILAPLRDTDGEIDRFVGLYAPTSAMPLMTGQTVHRFSLVSSQVLHDTDLPDASALSAEHLKLVSVNGRRIA